MSHFCVAVFSDSPDDLTFDGLLAPYNEEAFLVFHPISEEELKDEYNRFKQNNPNHSYENFLDCCGYVEEDGKWGCYYNPNAKYDYYSLDARYPYELKEKEDFDYCATRKKDYDYSKKTGDLEPYAFVTPDGVWHSPGTVGWFATSDDTKESRARYDEEWKEYINNNDNPYVSFVDMHI